MGADLVGKIEAGIPEDDPRNPAVIADNVGDNVGDCAGMAADLFETYAVTAVAVMLLGVLTFQEIGTVATYPLVIGGVSLLASIIGTYAVRSRAGNVERALYQGLIVSGVLAAIAFLPITLLMMDDLTYKEGVSDLLRAGTDAPTGIDLWFCTLVGVGVTAGLFVITDYYTSTRFRPVRTTARASQTGHATNIIQGLAQGFQSTAAPALLLVGGILLANELAGIYGIGVAVMAQLSLTGLIVALDAFGPITDNAGGIAEMADLPEEVRDVTDPLDAVGNTTKAVTKGYAIGSAVLAALVLFAAFVEELREEAAKEGAQVVSFDISQPEVLVGLIVGGMMVYLFAALAIEAVGRAGGGVVEEVRRQFREKPGIMDRTEKPDYAQAVAIVTASAQKEMIIPALIPIVVTLVVGLLSTQALGGLLIGVIVVGFFMADLDDRRRRRLGQREEADRGRRVRRKGLGGPRGLGHRRHGRRPLQGHRRPGDQPDDQGREHRGPADHPVPGLAKDATPADGPAAMRQGRADRLRLAANRLRACRTPTTSTPSPTTCPSQRTTARRITSSMLPFRGVALPATTRGGNRAGQPARQNRPLLLPPHRPSRRGAAAGLERHSGRPRLHAGGLRLSRRARPVRRPRRSRPRAQHPGQRLPARDGGAPPPAVPRPQRRAAGADPSARSPHLRDERHDPPEATHARDRRRDDPARLLSDLPA